LFDSAGEKSTIAGSASAKKLDRLYCLDAIEEGEGDDDCNIEGDFSDEEPEYQD